MIYFVVSMISGICGGFFSSQVASQYSLGTVGNIVTGFLGGVVAHLLIVLVMGGTMYVLAIVGGFLGGVVARAAFTIIRQRMVTEPEA